MVFEKLWGAVNEIFKTHSQCIIGVYNEAEKRLVESAIEQIAREQKMNPNDIKVIIIAEEDRDLYPSGTIFCKCGDNT